MHSHSSSPFFFQSVRWFRASILLSLAMGIACSGSGDSASRQGTSAGGVHPSSSPEDSNVIPVVGSANPGAPGASTDPMDSATGGATASGGASAQSPSASSGGSRAPSGSTSTSGSVVIESFDDPGKAIFGDAGIVGTWGIYGDGGTFTTLSGSAVDDVDVAPDGSGRFCVGGRNFEEWGWSVQGTLHEVAGVPSAYDASGFDELCVVYTSTLDYSGGDAADPTNTVDGSFDLVVHDIRGTKFKVAVGDTRSGNSCFHWSEFSSEDGESVDPSQLRDVEIGAWRNNDGHVCIDELSLGGSAAEPGTGGDSGSAGGASGGDSSSGGAESGGGGHGSPDSSFVHAQGQNIVHPDGRPFLLKSVNLGGLLVIEGYLWGIWEGLKQREIESRLNEIVGTANADTFWTTYRQNFITQADMDRIQALGFNSVRLPLNARLLLPEGSNTFREQGFTEIDRVLELAERAGLFVILDMHAAPGGQTGAKDIDDSSSSFYCPELWGEGVSNRTHRNRLVTLWTEIARRYAGDATIAGFDLLNEPLAFQEEQWNECWVKNNYQTAVGQLWPLYERLVSAIRGMDENHMLIVEGHGYGSDFSSLRQPPAGENNMTYSFHFYNTYPHINNIARHLDMRNAWNVPLWVGEFGEDDNRAHYACVIELMESQNVGWGFWTWKRMESQERALYDFPKPSRWDHMRRALRDGEDMPQADGRSALNSMSDRIPFPSNLFNANTSEAFSDSPTICDWEIF